MRIWLERNRPIEHVREELVEVNPIAYRYLEIGEEYKDLGQYQKAMESYREALSVAPENLQAQVNIASVHLEQNDYQEAVAAFEKALTMDDEDVAARSGLCEANLAFGDQLLTAGDIDNAMSAFKQVLTINADHTEARQRMADIYHRAAEESVESGHLEEALRAFGEALGYTPEDQELVNRHVEVRKQRNAQIVADYMNRAEAEISEKDWDQALVILEEALRMVPGDEVLLAALARTLEEKRKDVLANILARADRAREQERWDQVVASLEEYLQLVPDDPQVQERLIEAQERKRESDLLEIKMRARSLAESERWEEALSTWQDYLALEPDDRETIQLEIQHIEQTKELAEAYIGAKTAMEGEDYNRAVGLLKKIIMIDETYKDSSRLLVEAIDLRRREVKFWQRPWLWAAAGIILVVVVGFWLAQPDSPVMALLGTVNAASQTGSNAMVTPGSPETTPVGGSATSPTSLSWSWITSAQGFAQDEITAIAADPVDPNVVYIGTADSGILRSQDGGVSWQTSHDGIGGADIFSLAGDPQDPSTLYAGILMAGVYKSTDGGEHWKPINQGIELPGWEDASAVVLDPQDNQHLYFTQGYGFYESLDGGESWSTPQTSACPTNRSRMIIHPSDGNILFTTDISRVECDNGLYRSIDGGVKWVRMALPDTRSSEKRIAIDAQTGSDVYFSDWENGLYGSSDGGDTWNKLLENGCLAVAVSPQDGSVVHCSDGARLWKSEDGGGSWESISREHNDFWSILVSPHDTETLFLGSNIGPFRSVDGGFSWTETFIGSGAGFLELKFDPSERSTLYVEDHTGTLHRSSNGGRTWEMLTDQGFGLALDARGEVLYRLNHNNHTLLRSTDSGRTWDQLDAPEAGWGTGVIAHPTVPGTLYLYGSDYSETRNFIYISYDGGYSWHSTEGLVQDDCRLGLSFDHDLGQVIYAVDHGCNIHRSSDSGKNWVNCNWTRDWVSVTDTRAVVDPRDSNRLLVATRGSGVMRSENGCVTWGGSSTGLGNWIVNSLAVHPQNPEMVYAGTDGGAYVSFDGGETWTEINDGLVGAPIIFSIAIDPRDPNNVFAATPFGIFKLVGQ
jgi:tetratricopeptide (TPR) repeat protein/photosystem II stability/assembly factor-like uncharacterized protein